ncbi:hypothetical protein [Neisseria musculi]|uniref:hypothetical protein n=1 Tax=Neisseria musculi TaxID=1815583 RepID=UPI00164B9206|nr:hypothetical protein [Neisseria musculi]
MPHGNERSKQKGRLKPEVIQTAFGHLPHHKNTITIIQTLIIGNRHRLYHTENPISLPAPAVAASVSSPPARKHARNRRSTGTRFVRRACRTVCSRLPAYMFCNT